jgi:hypothetical protein
MPIVIVAGGPAAVIVTLSVPPDKATVNGVKELPATGTVPEKFSTVGVAAGLVGVVELVELSVESDEQAPAVSAQATTRASVIGFITLH